MSQIAGVINLRDFRHVGRSGKPAETAAKEDAPTVETPEEVTADFEAIDEVEEEWTEDETPEKAEPIYTAEDKERMRAEIKSLREFKELAKSIVKNSKGEVLLTALEKGFAKARELGAPEKAIIFTESTRTQEYLFRFSNKRRMRAKSSCSTARIKMPSRNRFMPHGWNGTRERIASPARRVPTCDRRLWIIRFGLIAVLNVPV